MLRRMAAGALYDAKTSLARYPWIAVPVQRVRGRGELIDEHTDVVIEAFPRCASSFAVAAFRLAQEPSATNIAHHTHMPAQVMEAATRGLPTMVLLREAVDAVVSHVIRNPDLSVRAAMRGYLRFYEPLAPLGNAFVPATFDEVIGGGFGAAIERMNARFHTTFSPFEHTPENVARIDDEIERDYRSRAGSTERLEAIIPRPSAAREAAKARVRDRIRREVSPRTLAEAHAIYRALLPER